MNGYPSYLSMFESGELRKLSHELLQRLASCDLCPRRCGVDRLKGENGFCSTGRFAKIYTYRAHRGEEPAISGEKGSGTVFFTNCNMRCVYCQNYQFSRLGKGTELTPEKLAGVFLKIQEMGCHNLNLVTPAHVIAQIIESLAIAAEKGFSLPIVYNSSGYDSIDVIKMLNGVVDIYLPDMRYSGGAAAGEFSSATDYPEINKIAVKEMFAQAGILSVRNGIAKRGMIIRHLVLPGGLAGTEEIFKFISNDLSKKVHISLMRQYNPVFRAQEDQRINRRITDDEYDSAVELLSQYGLENGWVQERHEEDCVREFLGANFESIA